MDKIIRKIRNEIDRNKMDIHRYPHMDGYRHYEEGLEYCLGLLNQYIADQSPDLNKPPADGEVLPEVVDNAAENSV
jgi:hypothetical protein